MNPVVHFELPYKDKKRAIEFYASAFNWKLQDLGEEGNNYVLATTAETDAKPGFPAGVINGGLYPIKPDWPHQHPSVVVGVKNIQESMQRIQKSGGEVLGDPIEIPGFGFYVSFVDTEGNRLSIIEPKM
jgi:predicted enzyme related to lactoylglutathione lyase